MKQFLPIILLVAAVLFFPLCASGINYYSIGTNSSPTTVTNWKSNTDGTGSSPTNFTTADQVFIVQDGHKVTLTGTWTISGTGSMLTVNAGGTFADNNGTFTGTVLMNGIAGKYGRWEQTGNYPGITFSPSSSVNSEFILSIGAASAFRVMNYPGTLVVSGTTGLTVNGLASFSVGGDWVIGSNIDYVAASSTSVNVTVGGSLLMRSGGQFTMTSGTGGTNLTVGGSIFTGGAGSTLKQGGGTATGAVNMGSNSGQDTISVNATSLRANVTANGDVLLAASLSLPVGTLIVPAGATNIFNFLSNEVTGSGLFNAGSGATLVTTLPAGFRNAANTAGNIRVTGIVTIADVNLEYQHSTTGSTGLAGISQTNFRQLVHNGLASLVLDKGITLSNGIDQKTATSLDITARSVIITGGSWSIISGSTLLTSSATYLTIRTGTAFAMPAVFSSFAGTMLFSGTGTAITFNGTVISVGESMKITHSASVDLSGKTFTIHDTLDRVSGTLTTNSSTDMDFQGNNGYISGLTGLTALRNLTLNRAGATLQLGSAMSLSGALTLRAGTLDIATSNTTLTFASGSSFPTFAGGTLLTSTQTTIAVNAGGTFGIPAAFTTNNGRMTINGTTTASLQGDHTIGRGLTITSGGRIDFSDDSLTLLDGNITIGGTTPFVVNNGSALRIEGTGIISNFSQAMTLNSFEYLRQGNFSYTSGLAVLSKFVVGTGVTYNHIGQMTLSGFIQINGTLDLTGLSSFTINGLGSISGSFGRLLTNNCILNRSGQTIRVTDSLHVSNTFTLTSGTTLNTSSARTRLTGVTNTISGTWLSDANSSFHFLGNTAIANLPTLTTVKNLTLGRLSLTLTPGSTLTVTGVFSMTSSGSTLDMTNKTLVISGPYNYTNGTILNNFSTSVTVNGTGTFTGGIPVGSLSTLTIDRAGASVALAASATIGGALNLTAGNLDISGRTLQLMGPATFAAGTNVVTNTASTFNVTGIGAFTNMPNFTTIGALTLQRAGLTFIPEDNLLINGNFIINNGIFDYSGRTVTFNGQINISGSGSVVKNSTSSCHITGSSTISSTFPLGTFNNFTLNRAGLTLALGAAMNVNGTFDNPAGTLAVESNTLTLSGPIVSIAGVTMTSASNLVINNTGAITTGTRLSSSAINNFTFARSGETLSVNLPAISGTFTHTSGTLRLGDNATLGLNGNISLGSGTLDPSAKSSILIDGAGTVSGTLTFDSVGTFRIGRTGYTHGLVADLVVANVFELMAGTLDIQNRTLTLGGAIRANTTNTAFVASNNSTVVIDATPGYEAYSPLLVNGLPTTSVTNLTINRSGMVWPFASSGQTITGTLLVLNGQFDATNKFLTLSGSVDVQDSLVLDNTTLTINGSGSLVGNFLKGNLASFNNSRAALITQTGDLVVAGAFSHTNGQYDFSGQSLTLNGSFNSSSSMTFNDLSSVHIGGSGTFSGLTNLSTLANFTLNRSGLTFTTTATDFVVNGNYQLLSGTHEIIGKRLFLNGPILITNGVFTSSNTTNLVISGAGAITGAFPITVLNTINLFRTGATFKQATDLVVTASYVQDAGTHDFSNKRLTITGSLGNTNGNFVTNLSSGLVLLPSNLISKTFAITELKDLIFFKTGASIRFSNSITIQDTLRVTSGSVNVSGITITMNGPVSVLSSTFTSSTTTSVIFGGAGSLSNNFNFAEINNFTFNRPSSAFNYSSTAITVNGTFELRNCSFNLLSKGLTLRGPVVIVNSTFMSNSLSRLNIQGSGTIDGSFAISTLTSLIINRPNVTFVQASDLTVSGTYTLSNGTHDFSGRRLTITGLYNKTGGNFLTNSSSGLAILSSTAVSVTFDGTVLKDLIMNSSGSTITLSNSITIHDSLRIVQGNVGVNGITLTLNGPVIITGSSLLTTATTSLVIGGSGTLSATFPAGSYVSLTMNRVGATLVHLSNNLSVGAYNLLNGTHQLSNVIFTINGNANFGSGTLTGNGTLYPDLSIAGTGSLTGALRVANISTLNISRDDARLRFAQNVAVSTVNVSSARDTLDIRDISFTVTGNYTGNGMGFNHNANTSFHVIGSGTVSGLGTLSTLNNFSFKRPLTYTLGSDLVVNGTLDVLTTTTINISNYKMTVRGIVWGGPSIVSNGSSIFEIAGSGSCQSITFISNGIHSIISSRALARLVISAPTNFTISNSLQMTAGTLVLNDEALILSNATFNVVGSTVLTNSATSIATIASAANGVFELSSDSIGTISFNASTLGSTLRVLNNLVVKSTITVGNNTFLDFRNRSVTLLSSIFIATGSLLYNSSSSLLIGGSSGIINLAQFTAPLNNFSLTRTNAVLTRNDLKVLGKLTVGSTSRLIIADTLHLFKDWEILGTAEFNGSNSSDLVIEGNGTTMIGVPRTGVNRALASFTMNKPGYVFNVNNALGIQSNFNLIGGRIDVGDGRLEVIANGTVPTDSITYGSSSTIYVGANSGETLTGFPMKGSVDSLVFIYNSGDGAMIPLTGTMIVNYLQAEGVIKLNGHRLVVNESLYSLSFPNILFNTTSASSVELNLTQPLTDNVRFLTMPSTTTGDLADFKYNFSGADFALQDHLTIHNKIQIPAGNITCGTRTLTLGPSAIIENEDQDHKIIGTVRSTRSLGTGGNTFGNMGFAIGSGAEDIGNVVLTRRNAADAFFTVRSNNSISTHYSVSISGTQPVSGRPISFSWYDTESNGNDFSSNSCDIWRRNTPSDPFLPMANNATITRSGNLLTVSGTTNHFSDFVVTDDNHPLPVEFGVFAGERANKAVRLYWTTLVEEHNRGFVVERSFDGLAFDSVGFVKGVGYSTNPLRYTYQDISQPAMAYYRLRQQDFDLTEKLSPVVTVAALQVAKPQVYVSPEAELSFFTSDEGVTQAEIMLFDASGKQVFAQTVNRSEVVSIRSFPAGIYTYRIAAGGQFATGKLVR